MFFNLQKSAIYQAVIWRKFFYINKKLKKVFLVLFLVCIIILGVFLYTQQQYFIPKGLLIILFCLLIGSYLKNAFFENKLKKPLLENSLKQAIETPSEINFACFLNYESACILNNLLNNKKFKNKDIKQIHSNFLLYFLLSLKKSPEINFILSRLLITKKEIQEKINFKIDFDLNNKEDFISVEKIIFRSAQIAQQNKQKRIKAGNIFTALSENNLILKRIFIEKDVKKDDIKNLNWWFDFIEDEIQLKKRFWSKDNLANKGAIAKHLAYGFTVTLDKFSTDWTTNIEAQKVSQAIFFHHQGLDSCETILAKIQEVNNVLLVGEPGVGKSSIIYKLAQRIFLNKSLSVLNSKRVVFLDLSLIFSQASKDRAEAILDTICQEVVRAGNIILVIDNFHDYIPTRDRPVPVDILSIFSSYLSSPNFQIIAITNFQGLANVIEPHPSLLNLLEKIEVQEPSIEQVYRVVEGAVFYFEQRYNRFITYPAIRTVIECSGKYIPEKLFPKKATDLLSQVFSDIAKEKKEQIILPKHIYRVISKKIGFQVGELGLGEKEKLINLEDLIHQRVIGQEQAVQEISNALRRSRSEIAIRKGPMGAFLFFGPTGVGKTETAKALADIYFGSENKIIRFDMAEFQNVDDITRLVGTKTNSGYLTTKVRENPFSLILLDEIEKAHHSILDLFLVILDEGYIVDPLRKKISFINTIIIATSNVGYKIILDSFKQKQEKNISIDLEKIEKDIIEYSFSKSIFKPEFINRFDGVILFHPLDKNHLFEISNLLLKSLKKNLEEKDIEFIITNEIRNKIIEIGYNITYGAREMRRVIQDKIENVISMALLKGEIKKGDKIEINAQDFVIIKY